jgi:hypothetical protein
MRLVWDQNARDDYLWWHRLVYKATETKVRIAACRYHYGH